MTRSVCRGLLVVLFALVLCLHDPDDSSGQPASRSRCRAPASATWSGRADGCALVKPGQIVKFDRGVTEVAMYCSGRVLHYMEQTRVGWGWWFHWGDSDGARSCDAEWTLRLRDVYVYSGRRVAVYWFRG